MNTIYKKQLGIGKIVSICFSEYPTSAKKDIFYLHHLNFIDYFDCYYQGKQNGKML